jgi:hypothetical protein
MARMPQIGDPESVSVVVALDIDAEPIHGSVDDGSGASIEFTGWLELMSVITRLSTGAHGLAARPSARQPRGGREE